MVQLSSINANKINVWKLIKLALKTAVYLINLDNYCCYFIKKKYTIYLDQYILY